MGSRTGEDRAQTDDGTDRLRSIVGGADGGGQAKITMSGQGRGLWPQTNGRAGISHPTAERRDGFYIHKTECVCACFFVPHALPRVDLDQNWPVAKLYPPDDYGLARILRASGNLEIASGSAIDPVL